MKINLLKSKSLVRITVLVIYLFCTGNTIQAQNVLTDDYSNASLWTVINNPNDAATPTFTQGTVGITNGTVSFSNLHFETDDYSHRKERRIFRELPQSALNQTEFMADFEYKITNSGSLPSAYILCLTAGNLDPLMNEGLDGSNPNNYSNQDAIMISNGAMVGGNASGTLNYVIKQGKTTTAGNSTINVYLNTTYYVRLERISATLCKLNVFSDIARMVHVAGSPLNFSVPANLNAFTHVQHCGVILSGAGRTFGEATLDNLNITNTSLNSLEELNNDSKKIVSITPNPTSANTLINFNIEKQGKLVVIDMLGNKIKNVELNANQTSYLLETSDMAQGVYFVELYDDQTKVNSKKLVLQK